VIPFPSVSVGSIGCSGGGEWRGNAFGNKALADFRPELTEGRKTLDFDS